MNFNEVLLKKRDALIQTFKFKDLKVRFVSREEFISYFKKNESAVFGGTSNYLPTEEEKQRGENIWEHYSHFHTDFLILTDSKNNYVGHFVGEIDDKNSFYLKNGGLLPEWRKKKIASEFIEHYLNYLYDLGYSKVISKHHGYNRAVLIMMLKQGFNICGMEIKEEWGTLITCVKFLQPEREDVFNKVSRGTQINN